MSCIWVHKHEALLTQCISLPLFLVHRVCQISDAPTFSERGHTHPRISRSDQIQNTTRRARVEVEERGKCVASDATLDERGGPLSTRPPRRRRGAGTTPTDFDRELKKAFDLRRSTDKRLPLSIGGERERRCVQIHVWILCYLLLMEQTFALKTYLAQKKS